ncbi:NAD(P)H-hydrate dehydratase [Dasania sp. GY-MA-18]|uniref:Bifunctional NAD(P)H-hydrate repair enzyme n=1 Tax=Dasania phycosphaerae TaxID=2950436 RepID=A0A9J6RM03_9GAMM|nr:MULTISPECIES: NAD(P)H-hydrate dehydratase [Dasania]MCR8923115.1 NAD(P)H-hydrate dehydratase [Dasania sp. GY-MA-18]MCZ0865547.1 NAD(P)H-hydrate dehydratase [Dasania phycosphaerae]MCZ0869272.1 NAD(P)H-hydrate dehydratase [Dasania phycosphaerae]
MNTTKPLRCGDDLPTALYTAAQVRELDRLAMAQQGIAGFTLMRRAGRAAFEQLLRCWPEAGRRQPIVIVCGCGNNAGDGYVMASLAKQYGLAVSVLQVGDASRLQGDALLARQRALQDAVSVQAFTPGIVLEDAVVVDAILGTGLNGPVRAPQLEAINWLNQLSLPVLAVDVPSGLCSDTGQILGEAVNADITVSFIGLKQGLLTAAGPDVAGDVYFDGLGTMTPTYAAVDHQCERLLLSKCLSILPGRRLSSHKGSHGHVLVIGGDTGMGGAAIMAAEASARCGAGLVSCATQPNHTAAFISRSPEIMANGVVSGQELEPLLVHPSVLVLGPGLGKRPWGEQLLQQAYNSGKPMVVDADALNMISAGRVLKKPYRSDWLLTPHPAEAARLLGCSTEQVQANRFAAVRELQQRYGGAVILKGAGSLVASDEAALSLCSYGNPGMATGGMGDVLSGVLGALLAQGLTVAEAAKLGVCLHAYAGDIAAQQGMCGTMASDLIPVLRRIINGGIQ